MTNTKRFGLLSIIGPGILVAATGVGAGDLSAGAFTGSLYGMAVLWAVLLGAVLKYAMNEGLARFQLATGKTILEGCFDKFGPLFGWLFLLYLGIWTFLTAGALMSANGVVSHAILPIFETPVQDKIFWGGVHSLVAVGLILIGGYRLFEKVMSVCIAIMFFTVVATAILSKPDASEFLAGFWPTIPDWQGGGLEWTVALLGGVGGTLTIVCYGYWIREEGRTTTADLSTCRYDLVSGYIMTAIFGMAMVIVGSQTELPPGSSASTVVLLADRMQEIMGEGGTFGRWLFLVGAWGAVASSLLGVWQSVPYLFSDVFESLRAHYQERKTKPISTASWPYRSYLIAMAILPMATLVFDFKQVLKWTAICGALVIPFLAFVILVLGSQQQVIGREHRNPIWSTILLSLGLILFVYALALAISKQL
ncbi:Nramp family divalent metal transporter [Rubinisphaera sp. JC750]|uniref:Nramp family divalent metal transporter n=1 Tax=Rubinisphaera sp. JC750 TaxID=2898658 RepID=UPI001EFFC89F|nr:Nramp family divalent metal transporter [Rubinisphaera sp. JC750]